MTAFTVAQAAEELGYSRAMVYRLIADGLLGCRRLPGKGGIRILPRHIDQFNEAFECPATRTSSADAGAENGTSLTAIAGLARAQRTAQKLNGSSTDTSTPSPDR